MNNTEGSPTLSSLLRITVCESPRRGILVLIEVNLERLDEVLGGEFDILVRGVRVVQRLTQFDYPMRAQPR